MASASHVPPSEDAVSRWTLAGAGSALPDAHCHVQALSAAAWAQRRQTLLAAGVCRMLCCGTGPDDWDAVARRAAGAGPPFVVPAYGVHPWTVRDGACGWEEALQSRLAADPSAWIGECGLDETAHAEPGAAATAARDAVLALHLRLAAELGRPLVLHAAGPGAAARLLQTLRPWRAAHPGHPGGIIHGLVTTPELARAFRALGFRIGVGAAILDPRRRPRLARMLAGFSPADLCPESDAAGERLPEIFAALRCLVR